MSSTPREKLAKQFVRLERKAEAGAVDPDTVETLQEFADILDADVPHKTATDPRGKTFSCSPSTIELYISCLKIMLEAGVDPTDGDVEAANEYLTKRHQEGLSENTLIKYQCGLRAFYSAYPELGVNPEDVNSYTPDSSPRHDEQDLFTEEEVFAMRKACMRSRNPIRNRAFLELLIFSLQRVTALLTLRVRDVDLESGAIYLNDEYDTAEGRLKGALRRGRRRPIYGARKYVREWVQAHPTGDADDWLFVGDSNNPSTAEGEHWNYSSAYEMLKRLAKWADVDKPVNPPQLAALWHHRAPT